MKFNDALGIEQRSFEILLPWLSKKTGRALHITPNDKGHIDLQREIGDVQFLSEKGKLRSIEIKAEIKSSPNLFLEVWSNLETRKPGWMSYCQADFLLYYFMETDELYVANMRKLKEVFFNGNQFTSPLVEVFNMVPQCKYDQLNDTWGTLVPIVVLDEVLKPGGLKKVNPLTTISGDER